MGSARELCYPLMSIKESRRSELYTTSFEVLHFNGSSNQLFETYYIIVSSAANFGRNATAI